jgi:cytochrome c oxidase subunit 1
MYSETWGTLGCAAVSIGFILTFTPQFLLGNAGMPRRYATYPEIYQPLHVLSTVGACLLAAGMLITLGYLVVAIVRGRPAGPNPWRSKSFEWRSSSPPPHENFDSAPAWSDGPYDYEARAE